MSLLTRQNSKTLYHWTFFFLFRWHLCTSVAFFGHDRHVVIHSLHKLKSAAGTTVKIEMSRSRYDVRGEVRATEKIESNWRHMSLWMRVRNYYSSKTSYLWHCARARSCSPDFFFFFFVYSWLPSSVHGLIYWAVCYTTFVFNATNFTSCGVDRLSLYTLSRPTEYSFTEYETIQNLCCWSIEIQFSWKWS